MPKYNAGLGILSKVCTLKYTCEGHKLGSANIPIHMPKYNAYLGFLSKVCTQNYKRESCIHAHACEGHKLGSVNIPIHIPKYNAYLGILSKVCSLNYTLESYIHAHAPLPIHITYTVTLCGLSMEGWSFLPTKQQVMIVYHYMCSTYCSVLILFRSSSLAL